MSKAENHFDAVVAGAGLAGLKAALQLKAAGKKVLLLEARDRVGGRSKAGEIGGQVIDHGGQWVGPQQQLLLEQASELGVKTCRQFSEGNSLLYMDGKLRQYSGDIPRLPLPSLLELGLVERRWQRHALSLPAGAPWSAKQAARWDAQSVESWLQANIRSRPAREFVRVATRALLCAEPQQVSYLCLLEYLRQGHGLESLLSIEGGAQQDKFVGGAWQIPQRMAEQLHAELQLNSPVLAVEQGAEQVTVITANNRYSCSHLIMALPPTLAAQVHYSAALPAKKFGLLQRMPMGAVLKVHIAYQQLFWRQRGLSGAAVGSDRHLSVVFDQTEENSGQGVLVGLIEGAHALAMSDWSEEARRQQVVADLVNYFGPDAAQPQAYVEQDWTQEYWSRGGYVAHMPPGVLTQYGPALREPCGRIHWAGTETATEWCGYLDGALQSGIRAAGEVIAAQV